MISRWLDARSRGADRDIFADRSVPERPPGGLSRNDACHYLCGVRERLRHQMSVSLGCPRVSVTEQALNNIERHASVDQEARK